MLHLIPLLRSQVQLLENDKFAFKIDQISYISAQPGRYNPGAKPFEPNTFDLDTYQERVELGGSKEQFKNLAPGYKNGQVSVHCLGSAE